MLSILEKGKGEVVPQKQHLATPGSRVETLVHFPYIYSTFGNSLCAPVVEAVAGLRRGEVGGYENRGQKSCETLDLV